MNIADLSQHLLDAAALLDMKPKTNGDAKLMREAAEELRKLHEAYIALQTVAFAAWDALNEIHHDAAGMEDDLKRALDAYGSSPVQNELWQAQNT